MKTSVGAISIGILTLACWVGRAGQSPARTDSALDLAHSLNMAFAQAADHAKLSVIVIRTTSHAAPASSSDTRDPWDVDLQELPPELRRYFENRSSLPDLSEPQASREGSDRLSFEGQGSGIILREDGYLLTNRHVVEGADRIEVKLPDGRELPAKLCGADQGSDLAVLKIEAKGLQAARLGDSDRVRVGEFALAVGAPFELESTVTFGHISAKGRQNVLEDVGLDQDFLQTDAQINPGNSGGPLVNIDGEVVGINTLIRGMRTGIGFAIPINQVREVSDQLIRTGRYQRPWLGISVRSLRESSELRNAFPEAHDGLVVKQIETGGPAASSDLKAGDLIQRINGQSVATLGDFKRLIRSRPVGEPLKLEVNRSGQLRAIQLTAVATPNRPEENPGMDPSTKIEEERELGMLLRPLPSEMATQEGLARGQGILVSDVAAGSLAERSGLKPGAILTDLNRRPIAGLRQFRDALKSTDPHQAILLNFVFDGSAHFEVLKLDSPR